MSKSAPVAILETPVGVGVRYFFHTGIARELESLGFRVVAVSPGGPALADHIERTVPGACLEPPITDALTRRLQTRRFARFRYFPEVVADYLQITGMSDRLNLIPIRALQRNRNRRFSRSRYAPLLPFINTASGLMKRSRLARRGFESWYRSRRTPGLYGDLFRKYKPDVVVASSPGWWKEDFHLIQEAKAFGVPSLAVLVGWDHTWSKGLAVAKPDRIVTWSEIQRDELEAGCDIPAEIVQPIGAAHFDSYSTKPDAGDRERFFASNGLDLDRRLISFACSFVGMSSNYGMVRELARAMADGTIHGKNQLLIRLHPTHMKQQVAQYAEVGREVPAYEELARTLPNVRIQYPDLSDSDTANMTNPDDLTSIVSFLHHSDVLVTTFSTMTLEATITDTPVVNAAVDPEPEWVWKNGYPISSSIEWPTHERIIKSGATMPAYTYEDMISAVNTQLADPGRQAPQRATFAKQEIGHTDGRTAERIASYISDYARASGTGVKD